jgi:hypothetical protein
MFKTSVTRLIPNIALLTMTLTFASTAMGQSDVATKLKLQAAMQTYIEEKLVDGKFLYLDSITGVVSKARPGTAHPTILAVKNGHVLCADFRTSDGRTLNVDFFVSEINGEYAVYSHSVEHRSRIKRLMKAGLARKI